MIAALAALVLLGAEDGGVVVGSGGLSKDVIAQVVKRHSAEVRYCYERELQRAPKLMGKLSVTFVIGADGKVQSAAARETALPPGLVDCVRSRVMKFVFPPPKGGGVVSVTWPWIFSQE